MTASVQGQPWLEATATRAVMAALEAAGGADCARFVGGCVRNSLMGRAVDDIDIATRLTPEQTMAAL
ncbi:MAG: CCA tRNA nucleotidyltransferase, partial [Pseudomonadota bacterium]|nr:CCA tRNA nucleotidyltransferase [Pseudomonadota bacterium]